MEKKQLISVVKPLIAAALLFGSSGGVAWGQTQMDCKNAFGAGESRSDGSVPAGTPAVPNRGGAGKITSETDGWLVTDPNNTPNTSIIIGTTSPNVVGEKWIFTGILPPSQQGSGGGWIDAYSSTYHIGVNATSCYDHRNCGVYPHDDWRTTSGSGTSQSESPVYTGCDNTFFRNHGGSYYRPNSNWAGADFTSNLETVVNIGSGALGGNLAVGTSGTNAFDCDYFYFKNIPYQIKTITITGSNVPAPSNGCANCMYTTYSKNIAHPGGNVDQGRIVLDAGSHIHLRKNISADGGSGSKAILDLPSGGNQYSLMVDGNIDEAAVNSRSGGVINNLATMAPKAVIGVYGNYLPSSSGAMGTNAAGGTILIGPATTGQNKMTITASTSANGSAYSFSSLDNNCTSVYTGTWVPADGTANLGNYGDHDIKVDATMKIAGTTPGTGTMAAGKMQIFNMKKSLTFDNFIPNIPSGATGNFLMLAANELKMSASSTHTSNIGGSGSMTLMGAKVTLDKDELITLANNSSGNYNVIAYATRTDQYAIDHVGEAPGVAAFGPYGNTCSGMYGTCASSAFDAEKIKTPWPNIQSTQLAGISGTSYDANTCMPAFTHVNIGGGNITFNNATNSTVNVDGNGFARWQAFGSISTGTSKTLNWTVANTAGANATASWIAGGNIGLGTNSTTNWSTASTHAGRRIFWDAGQDINTNSLTAEWSTTGKGDMYWRAGRAINAGTTANPLAKVDWSSSNASKGSMRWEARAIRVVNGTSNDFKFTQEGSAGITYWGAEDSISVDLGSAKDVLFTNSSTAANGAGTMMWITNGGDIITKSTSGKKVVFEQTNATAGTSAWKAGYRQDGPPHNTIHRGSIRTNNVIEFKNAANNPYDMIWQACNSILTNHNATTGDSNDDNMVTFENNGKGNMIWHAADSIVTRSKTNFHNTSSAEGNMTWFAGNHIKTRLGTDDNTDDLQKGIIFKQEGKGRTTWWAETGNIETYNPVHFDWTTTTDDATSILWWAGQHIEIGNNFNSTAPKQSRALFDTNVNDTITLKTRNGHILTNSQVDFKRTNTGKALTQLWAGCRVYGTENNIDIENVFNYTETAGQNDPAALVHLYAENDIRSNWVCDNNRPAPITFDVSAAGANTQTRTLWEAERNIETKGRADFNYKGATAAKSLVWLSRAGYIQTERPVTVAYESDDTVSFRAETWRHDVASNSAVLSNAIASGRQGNIHFFDSINIKRYNTGVGVTEIKAENHIWTAMVDYWENSGATANKMDIISHKGDIYLGYNNGITDNYSHKFYIANQQTPGWKVTQKAPSASCIYPNISPVSYDKNIFKYYVPASNTSGHLWIKAGWEEKTDRNSVPDKTSNSNIDTARASGGNIYFTHINVKQETGSNHPTVISIPHSGLWLCGRDSLLHNRRGDAMEYYENAGIISGVSRCLHHYPDPSLTSDNISDRIGLIYRGAIGDLTVDAGNRGNIIFNKGAYLSFEDPSSTGNVVFRTRFGDIDMRTPFDVDTMHGSLLFLAQIENIADLEHSGFCGCTEERNNVYLQDFEFKAHGASGSVFVGADNNIKLNYGGLQNIGTRHDPFLSKDYTPCRDGGQAKIGWGYDGTKCGDNLHCDAIESENKARPFLMKFDKDANGTAITKGGFAAVASDYIDVYKKFAYYGGSGDGMGSVPGTGTLHGETVTGYGLFMKTQANKGNWNVNIFENTPTCPTPCDGTNCGHDYLHMVSRMTFHDDAYIEAQNQEVMLWSPVIETFGDMTLDSEKDKGSKTEITLKADSLIFHSDFIKKGKNIKLSTWSGLHNDLPIMKFGHMRKTPPFIEAKKDDCGAYTECVPCYRYIRFSKDPLHMLDTITIKFGDDAYMERLNTVIFDHTVLTCLTDSFDHVKGGAVQNAQIRTDTFKIRNQVDLFADEKHERDAHLELISEEQMGSKDYAGIYTKHLHMEPIGACGTPYSELWTSDDLALDVITTSIFGGFGFIHSDVHVENGGHLNAGFTSLRLKGMCYEQMCGTQRMKDLRLDVGAQLHFSVGTSKGLNGEYSDAIEVDRLTTYGSVDVNIEIRPCEKIEKRCYPIIYYKSVTPNSLNQLKLNPRKVKIDGEEYPLHLNLGTDGVVYVCVGDAQPVDINRTVTLPSVSGVKTDPGAGIWDVKSRGNFKFKATYSGSKPLAVRTNRTVNGVPEMLTGTKNANGEYEYVVPNVQQDITLSIGPDYVSNQLLAGTAVWSHGEMIYIRVDRADIASIYSVAGQLVRKVDLPEGDTSIPMSRGAYVITLKDGSVHKVIVK